MRWARVPTGRVVAVGCVPVRTVCSVSAAAVLQVISNSPLEYFSRQLPTNKVQLCSTTLIVHPASIRCPAGWRTLWPCWRMRSGAVNGTHCTGITSPVASAWNTITTVFAATSPGAMSSGSLYCDRSSPCTVDVCWRLRSRVIVVHF